MVSTVCLLLYSLGAIHNLVEFRELVVISSVDGALLLCAAIPTVTAVGSVKPNLEYIAIVAEQFLELSLVVTYVIFRAITGLVSVPRREIDAELETVFLASLGEFSLLASISI